VKFFLDTDHISILQRQTGSEFLALSTRIAQQQPADLAFSVVSFHEQVLGCHTYLSRARTSANIIRGYGMLARCFRISPGHRCFRSIRRRRRHLTG
jgi:tRNA(fMet)-specific endonuclease VapC